MQALFARCRRALQRGAGGVRADHYVKRYQSVNLALGLIGYFLLELSSLRQLTLELEEHERFARLTGLAGLSKAQLPKALHVRPPALWGPLLQALLRQLHPSRVPGVLRVMDTTFFVMGSKLFARYFAGRCTPHTAGFKAGMVWDPQLAAPLRLVCRAGQGNDAQYLAELLPPHLDLTGQMYLFDRGFRRYRFYDELIERGAHFITRAGRQGSYEVQAVLPLDRSHPTLLSDELVFLGKGRYRMRHPLRRILLQTAQGPLVFLTSDRQLSAWEVTELYRRRWEIEVFFRWLKRVIGCQRPLAYSTAAAQHTLFAALVCYLLLLLWAQQQLPFDERGALRGLKKAWRRLRIRLSETARRHDLKCLGFL